MAINGCLWLYTAVNGDINGLIGGLTWLVAQSTVVCTRDTEHIIGLWDLIWSTPSSGMGT